VCNFTPVARPDYRIGVPLSGPWHEIVNTDARVYGGGGLGEGSQIVAIDAPAGGQPASLALDLPPLSTVMLCPVRG
jgi:1,4-alpha-glucan branching enzyme